MSKSVIFSGIQPTGNLHIGNYLGAVQNIVELQNSGKYQMYYFIADYHSLTGNMTAHERREQILRTAAELVAIGIDPKKTTLFVQSHVMEHLELAWIFNCLIPIAELERMTQFKDKASRQKKNINAGLFTYPALQAADILLYHGTVVPVGEDQVQHVELTRKIARWFNNKYENYFAEPEVKLTKTKRVMSLLDPKSKMGKSLGAGHVLELADESNVIEKKLKKAVTASEGGKGSAGVENLLSLLAEFADKKVYSKFAKAEKDGSIRYGDLKKALSDSISETFADFRNRRSELMENHDQLAEILANGAKKASGVASATMEDVRKLVGIR